MDQEFNIGAGFENLPVKTQIRAFRRWGYSLAEIGDIFGLTKQRISKICCDSVPRVRTKRLRVAYREYFGRWR